MKRIIMFVLLFAALKVAGQTTGYLRFDTVKIMKQNGTCELYIINKTKDSLGLLTNVGGGLTQFKRSRSINDSTIMIGNDTIQLNGSGGNQNLQQVLNNGSTLTENEVITLADSLKFTSGFVIIDSLRLPALSAQTDTTTYKPISIDASGNVNKMSYWPGSGTTGPPDLTSQRIGFGSAVNKLSTGENDLRYDSITNTLYAADSVYLNKKLFFTGNSISTSLPSSAIQFGNRYNVFYTDTSTGATLGTMMTMYPKYSCDTCRYNQPFYFRVGTADQGGGYPPNSAIQFGFGDGTVEKALGYVALEQRFFDQEEYYFEFKPENSTDRIRPFAYNVNITGSLVGNVQAIHTTDQNIYQAKRYAGKIYATTGPNAALFDPYLTATTNAVTSLTHKDSTTNTTKGGFSFDTQLAGGFYNTNYTYHGQQINLTTPAGFYYNSTGTGQNGSFGRNYIFSVSSANSNKILWVGKDWGGSFSQAFEVFNNQNTLFGPVNTADFGYKLQAVGSSAAFMAGNITVSTNAVIYPASYVHTLSAGGAAAGFGIGYKFEGHNAVNTKRDMAAVEAVYTDAANATEDADIVFRTIRAGTANTESFRIKSTGAAVFNNAFTFPTADGTNGQVLQTNGSGTVTWQTPSGGSTTLDQAIANGNTLTTTRSIDLNGNDLNVVTGATNILGLGPSDVFSYRALTADDGLYITKTGLPTATDHSFRLVLDTSTTQVKKIVEPKTYTCLLSQSGTSNPTTIVLGTNTVGTIVWTRNSTGNYTGTLSGAFTSDKTWLICQKGDGSGSFVNGLLSRGGANTLTLDVRDNSNAVTDNFTNMSIEIRVYP